MYDSINFHLEGNQIKVEDQGLFDGEKTSKINGRFDVGTSFVSGVRERMKRNGEYYPSINLSERTIGNSITGTTKVNRLETQTSLQKTRHETSKYEIDQTDYAFILKRTIEYFKMAGISTDIENLKNGLLDKLALSKSIILPSYYGTDEQIISCEFIKDRLIVFFERSTWELAYTGNEVLPFIWQKINTCPYLSIHFHSFSVQKSVIAAYLSITSSHPP